MPKIIAVILELTVCICALFCNVFILIQSVIPAHYFYGEIKGMETDGRKIINAITAKNKNGDPEQ